MLKLNAHALNVSALQEKNVGSDLLDGKVGRIYMPKQKVDSMALAKPKGLKRERREAAAERKAAKQNAAAAAGGDEQQPAKKQRAAAEVGSD